MWGVSGVGSAASFQICRRPHLRTATPPLDQLGVVQPRVLQARSPQELEHVLLPGRQSGVLAADGHPAAAGLGGVHDHRGKSFRFVHSPQLP